MIELLKNSFKATVEKHAKKQDAFYTSSSDNSHIPAVLISIAKSPTHLSFRIRDQGGGISPNDLPHIFKYTFTTTKKPNENEDQESAGPYAMQNTGGGGGGEDLAALTGQPNSSVLSGLGYGLSMTKIYTDRGRGSMSIVSMYGYGTDTYMSIRKNPLKH